MDSVLEMCAGLISANCQALSFLIFLIFLTFFNLNNLLSLFFNFFNFFCYPIVTCEELVYVTRCIGCGISKYKPQSLLLTSIVVRPLARILGCCGVRLSGEVCCLYSCPRARRDAFYKLGYLC